jgi:thymidylate synthase
MPNYVLYPTIDEIRDTFGAYLDDKNFVVDKSGVRMIEIRGVSFIANEDKIFDDVNWDYVSREIRWYESQSRYVEDLPAPVPEIWTKISDKNGMINSNYGWMIFSSENYNQYHRVLEELKRFPESRRTEMIYQRPSMWVDYDKDGMSDFCCTDSHSFFVRNGRLEVHVKMRSNDVRRGYRNDRAWAHHVQKKLLFDLNTTRTDELLGEGDIMWTASSLHIYEPDFFLVDHYSKTGETTITKKRYRELYPESEWC